MKPLSIEKIKYLCIQMNINELEDLSKSLIQIINYKKETIVEENIQKLTTLAWLDKFKPKHLRRPIGMSVRLYNVLERYEKYFPFLEDITYEKAMGFRNFGPSCWDEFVKEARN